MVDNRDDFAPFLDEDLDEYVARMAAGPEWGGQLELLALARVLRATIIVYQATGNKEQIEGDSLGAGSIINLSYHRHYYQLGAHYNSVVPIAA